MYHNLIYDYPFTSKENLTRFQILIFLLYVPSLILSQSELTRIELPKLTTKLFNGRL